jgi:hypothetical protein
MDEQQAIHNLVSAIASGDLILIFKSLLGVGVTVSVLMVAREVVYHKDRRSKKNEQDPIEIIAKMLDENNKTNAATLKYFTEQMWVNREFMVHNLSTAEQASTHREILQSILEKHDIDEKTRHEQIYNLTLKLSQGGK